MSIPMPLDEKFIRLNGHLMASEREQHGFYQIRCAECQERNLDFIYSHSPCTEEELIKGMFRECECGEIHGKLLPGMVWGEDVTPICPCCSFASCTHKQQPAEASHA